MEKIKLNIQLGIAVALVAVGAGLLIAGFIVPPMGEIDNSVLVAFGEACTFAGSLIGVDYHYRYKAYQDAGQRTRVPRPHRPLREEPLNNDIELEHEED